MGGVGGSLFTGEAVLGVFGEDLLRPLNRRPILPPRPLDARLNESTCAESLRQCCFKVNCCALLDQWPTTAPRLLHTDFKKLCTSTRQPCEKQWQLSCLSA